MKDLFKLIIGPMILGGFIALGILHYQGNQTPPVVDEPLIPYVEQWRSDMDSAGIEYNWNRLDYIRLVDKIPSDIFGDGDPMRAGNSDQSTRSVYVRDAEEYQPIHIKVIVYHELAHYLLNINDHMEDGQILGSRLIEDPAHYSENWSILLDNYINYIKHE